MMFFLLFLFVINTKIIADQTYNKHVAIGTAESVQPTKHGVLFKSKEGTLQVTVYSPSIIKVHIAKSGRIPDTLSYAQKQGLVPSSAFSAQDTPLAYRIETDSMAMIISKNPIRIRFISKSGILLNEDEPAFGTGWIGEEVTTYKRLIPDEKFIGMGEKTGGLNRRGEGFTHWNTDYFGYPTNADPIYMSTPFYIGLHETEGAKVMYGIFMDNSYKSHFNFGASNDRFASFTAEDGDMTYYFIHHSTVSGIIESYTSITGRITLPPLWSLGFQQCRYSYYPDKEVLRVAETFREKNIPADVMYLDIHYMDKYKIFTWNKDRFPDPKGMISSLKQKGFNTAVIIDPGIKVEKGYAAYEEGAKDNLFLKYPDGTDYRGQVWPGWCHFPDFTNPKTRTWWGNSFKSLVDVGIRGFWNDMNEPATWGQRFPDLVEFSFEGLNGTHRRGHNVYGLEMARATFEGTKELLKGERPFILTRAGFSGVQRYSAVWTGDNVSSDDHMMLGVRMLSSLGLVGVPYVGMDIGGFSGNPSKELFARWISIGAFAPLSRAHVCVDNKDQEPWSFGERVEDIARNYLNLRYMMLPYIYSSFYQAHQNGIPIWRSLAIEYPFDSKIYDGRYQHQFTIGKGLMIAPVNSTQEFTKVYFPGSQPWYDFYTDATYAPSTEDHVDAPLEKLPVFVQGGSIIPMQSIIQHTGQKSSDTLFVHVYSAKNGISNQVLYHDDGLTYSYENGNFTSMNIRYDAQKNTLTFDEVKGSFRPHFTTIAILMHGFPELSSANVNGKPTPIRKRAISFMKALSNFDPLGSQSNEGKIPVQVVNIPYPIAKTNINW
jgi:alpha-glucosidase